MKKALITGITGQDGSYLAEFLLEKGYEVHGIVRRASISNTARIDHLIEEDAITLHDGNLSDSSGLIRLVNEIQPDEIYNLAAQSHVQVSFDAPEYSGDVDALGVLRIIVEKNLNLDLQTLTEEAARLYGDKLTNANVVDDVIDFMLGRFRAWYQDAGYTVDTIQAVLARRPTRPADFDARMKAVSHFRTLEAASALAAANKRVSNILAKTDEVLNDRVNASTLKEPEEIKLAMQVVVLRDKLEPYFAEGRYQDALVELAELREPVDAFFDKVMVMVDDKELRINRLTMLEKLRELFLRVADISLLQ